MARGYNQQTIVGNLGGDAELVHVGQNDTAKASFSIAATTGFGEHEQTEWFNVVVWGKRAEGLAQHLTKGKKVMVVGETRTRSWEGDDGQTRYRTEVHVTPYKGDIVLLGGGQRTSGPDVPAVEQEEEIPF